MYSKELILKSGEIFCKDYIRVVHGKRGSYVEFSKDQILLELISLFNNDLNDTQNNYYFYWLYPINHPGIKVYYQLKTVKYAGYKVGFYYVSPTEFINFQEFENFQKLF